MNKMMQKIASGLTAKLNKLKKLESVRIDNAEWGKTNKKPQIVDLWHQIQKMNHRPSEKYNRYFDFIEAERGGIEFWIYGGHPTLGKVIRKRLSALGVKFVAWPDEKVLVSGQA